ncbi:biotin synthase BioB [Cetobacterium sp. 8H]|uniref:biotin synthase BioB n=1 Tax=Cetobacterium sp. 8H TaxID=2759681 RepID=UPI00163D2106|nr:biotin synthase BioB [Cetobacterium sp. 8H]MBC2850778.1 biotin synthase BioB [Cetobacterium sp. 8H]
MKNFIFELKNQIQKGQGISFKDAEILINLDLTTQSEEIFYLSECANEIRKHFCGDKFNLCTIMNAKSGKCPEDCRYCAQSAHFTTPSPVYPLTGKVEALNLAQAVKDEGANRFSLVTSGRGLLTTKETLEVKALYEHLKANCDIHLCASHGLLNEESAKALKEAGVKTYHHNLETSRNFYHEICTTHSYQDRVDTIILAQEVGMEVCSGGIFGLGESRKDRLDMAFELKSLNIKSIPLNFLTPIEGTPMEKYQTVEPLELIKTIAVYRFINPDASIRYAGGRLQLGDLEIQGIRGGINSALTGNFLTTTGSTISSDKEMLLKEGFVLDK